jgi:hypothetical protein
MSRHNFGFLPEPEEEILEVLRKILHLLETHLKTFTLRIKLENSMSIGQIVAGTTGQLEAEVLENGVVYTPPVGVTYTPTITWTASDVEVTFSPATADDSGGVVPLSQQIVVNVPAGDPSTSVVITGSTSDPNGNPLSGSVTIPITAAPQVFTLSVTQVA